MHEARPRPFITFWSVSWIAFWKTPLRAVSWQSVRVRGRSTPARNIALVMRQTRSITADWTILPMTGIRSIILSTAILPMGVLRMYTAPTPTATDPRTNVKTPVGEKRRRRSMSILVGRGSFALKDLKKTLNFGSTKVESTTMVPAPMTATTPG